MIKINFKLPAFKTNADQTPEKYVFFKVGGLHLFRHKKICMKIIMPGILKTLLSFCEYRAFDSNLTIFYIITFSSPPSKIRH